MNQKRYWLRGGMSGLVIGIITIPGFITVSLSDPNSVPPIIKYLFGQFSLIDSFILKILHLNGGRLSFHLLILVILLTLIGMILGLIYGKMKNR
jgi:hypothetical protein